MKRIRSVYWLYDWRVWYDRCGSFTLDSRWVVLFYLLLFSFLFLLLALFFFRHAFRSWSLLKNRFFWLFFFWSYFTFFVYTLLDKFTLLFRRFFVFYAWFFLRLMLNNFLGFLVCYFRFLDVNLPWLRLWCLSPWLLLYTFLVKFLRFSKERVSSTWVEIILLSTRLNELHGFSVLNVLRILLLRQNRWDFRFYMWFSSWNIGIRQFVFWITGNWMWDWFLEVWTADFLLLIWFVISLCHRRVFFIDLR